MKTRKTNKRRRNSSKRRENKQTSEPFRSNKHLDINVKEAIQPLEALKNDSKFNQEWICASIEALQTNNYKPLAELFYNQTFIGKDRDFIIAAPYTVLRNAKPVTKLSILKGRVIFVPEIKKALKVAEKLQGRKFREAINPLLVIETTMATGNFDGQNGGEAFIVPDGFPWASDKKFVLPAFNNATEQFRRVKEAFKKIARIFDPVTAKILTAPLRKWLNFVRVQNAEYLFHDFGHHSGIGLNTKLKSNDFGQKLLATFWLQGFEECRADAMDFAIATKLLSDTEAKEIIASNFVTRFGIDAHRSGGIDSDYDVTVVLWLMDHLLKNGSLQIKNGKLSIRNIESDGLIQAVNTAITEGIEITREELKLENLSGLARLYSFKPEKSTLEIFYEFVVNPCRGLESNLR